MPKYLSGIQPTGNFHIGNYFGCIKPFISLKSDSFRKEKNIFLIADMHCYTKPEKASNVSRHVIDAARSLLAAGVDPETTHIVQQSKVSWQDITLRFTFRLCNIPIWHGISHALLIIREPKI